LVRLPPAPRCTLFPYTTLFRSCFREGGGDVETAAHGVERRALLVGETFVGNPIDFSRGLCRDGTSAESGQRNEAVRGYTKPRRRSEERRVGKEGRAGGWHESE